MYQDSDPEESPLTDSDLSLGFEVLGCLVQVGARAGLAWGSLVACRLDWVLLVTCSPA